MLDKETWDIPEIKARAVRLSKIIMQRYCLEKVVDDSIEFEYIKTITLDNYGDVTGKKLVSFNFLGDTYRQNVYAMMLIDVIKLLDKRTPQKLDLLATSGYSFNTTKRKHTHIGCNGTGMRMPQKIREGVCIEMNLSALSCVKFIDSLLSEYGINKDEFSFNVIADDTAGEEDDEIESE